MASSGAASAEYGLLLALIGSAVAVGIGVAVKPIFEDALPCFMQQLESAGTSAGCAAGGNPSNGTGDPNSGGGLPGTPAASASPKTPSPSPTSSKTPTPTPTPSQTPPATASP